MQNSWKCMNAIVDQCLQPRYSMSQHVFPVLMQTHLLEYDTADHRAGCPAGTHSLVLLVHAPALLQEAGQGVKARRRAAGSASKICGREWYASCCHLYVMYLSALTSTNITLMKPACSTGPSIKFDVLESCSVTQPPCASVFPARP